MIKKIFNSIVAVGRTAANGMSNHGVFNFAASMAFYTIFALPGLLITVTVIGGLFIDQAQLETELITQLQRFVGQGPAETVGDVLKKVEPMDDTFWKTAFGVGTLIFSATTIFVTLQEALNQIWDVRATPKRGYVKYLINRMLSLGMMLSLGFVLLVSLLLDSLLQMFFENIENSFGGEPVFWLEVTNNLVGVGIMFLVVYLIFKMLPDVKLAWKDIALAALITTGMLFLGKFLISLYLRNSDFSQTYDAAGSVILILMWVYYSTLVLLMGAEITRAIMIYRKVPIRPSNGAKKIKVQVMDYDEYESMMY